MKKTTPSNTIGTAGGAFLYFEAVITRKLYYISQSPLYATFKSSVEVLSSPRMTRSDRVSTQKHSTANFYSMSHAFPKIGVMLTPSSLSEVRSMITRAGSRTHVCSTKALHVMNRPHAHFAKSLMKAASESPVAWSSISRRSQVFP